MDTNKTKHTPGPWTFDARNESLKGSNGERIVVYSSGLSFGGSRTDETEANSRLIAAAPELLEALQEYLDCTPCRNDCAPDDMTCASNKARAAINKALGR